MNALKWALVVVAVALVSAAIGYGWAIRGVAAMSPPGAPGAVPSKAAGRILYYHDPMRPEVKFDRPGKSPFMDMELVPVYADSGAGTGSVAVSASARQSLGLRIGHVERALIAPRVNAVGSVSYDEHNVSVVQARVAGFVHRLHVRARLDRVHRGQILVEVTAPAWIEAEGEYLTLLRSDAPSNAALREATRQRLTVLGIPEVAILELEESRSVPTSTALRAAADGVVTELGLREGATFEAGTVLFRINGTATVWVDAQLPEAQARLVMPGAKAETRATARPEEVFEGRVQAILPQVDPATRTVGVRVAIDNTAGKLSPGMFVQTTLMGDAGAPQLWVPSEAVIATGERSVVIRVDDAGHFEVVDVTLGSEAGGKTAILTGLADGEAIVLSGQFLIDSEASLRSATNRLTTSSTATTEKTP